MLQPGRGAGRGCDNSAATGGASLHASGSAALPNDTLSFTSSGQTPTASSILLQGDASLALGVVFGQGVRCVGGNLKRLYQAFAAGGSASFPPAGASSVSVRSAALGAPIASGTQRYYTVYRVMTVLGGCAATSTFNSTNAFDVSWQ
ncbi:MAG: hypothetical protein IPJ19_13700 [Planctomycetes bacterium]|nr:hypothetical protein [Planctomycetota bacterium]